MSNYIRQKTKGGCYFFTVVTYQRRKILCLPQMRAALREAINIVRQTMPFEIIAWVLLPDHLHCIWLLPENDNNYGKRWSAIKSIVTKKCRDLSSSKISKSMEEKEEVGLWQRRFWEHQIRNEKDLENHLNYIHFNPVKHKYCQLPSQWQFSTLQRYIKQGIHSNNWGSHIDIPENIGRE